MKPSNHAKTSSSVILALAALLLLSAPAVAQEFVWAPDFPVGASIPAISAQDQDGNLRSFEDLKGDRGLLLMFSRSFDW
jgi:hypothetical protein